MKNLDVAIIDYNNSNTFSVKSVCDFFGLKVDTVNRRDQILNARSAILPGVGTFGAGMESLRQMQLDHVIREFIESGKPFMGICLGMQLLMSEGEEFGCHKGLDIIKGIVKKIPLSSCKSNKVKIPNIGWNKISIKQQEKVGWSQNALKDIPDNRYMYFVHSNYPRPEDAGIVSSTTNFEGFKFCSSISSKNVFACQFHPEKSGKIGLKIIKNFCTAIRTH